MVGNLLLELKDLKENEYIIITDIMSKEESELLKEVYANDEF